MTAVLPASTRAGAGELAVRHVSGQSAVTDAWAVNPLKLLVPRSRGISVWACLGGYGGGLVAGDQTRVTLNLGAGSTCFLSTQASTKVYRNPEGLPCAHRLDASLAGDSLLVLAPDPVQCFAGARYAQSQRFELAPAAGLVLVDALVAGRVARGERWAFTRFQSRNEVVVDGRPVFLDSLLLEERAGAPHQARRMGRFNALAMIYLTGPRLKPAAGALLDEVAGRPLAKRADFLISASPVGDGAVVRIAGIDIETVNREIRRQLKFVCEWLGDDPWARKW